MDHLGAVAARQECIPYAIQPGWEYDNQGFTGFPKRRGLEIQKLIDSGTHDLESNQLESFVQAWLFFGLLSEFSVERPRVRVDSFVKLDILGRQVITTEYLLEYLKSWRRYMLDMFSDDKRMARLHLARIGLVLKDAKLVVVRYCSSTVIEAAKWDINQSIAMSIMVLGETLRWAMNQLREEIGSPALGWMTDDDHGWGTSQLLMERMINRRWCPHSIYMFQGLMKGSVSGLYYASTFPDPPDRRKGRDHSSCSADRCKANDLNKEVYKLRHTTDNCQCGLVQPDIDQIVAYLEDGDIPLLHYTGGPECGKFQVVKYRLGIRFVVVSHVWSDGLGNPESNAMVSCQIARLNKVVSKFADFQGYTVYFWIDSLMVPVGPASKKARKTAIRQMSDIYSVAHWTLVLDADLMDNNVGSDYLEPAMRITISGWMQRLWTLQEGVMSRSIFFLFKDGLQDIEDLELLYRQAASQSSVAPAARSFYLNLMRPRAPQHRCDIALVSSVWKAIQWRRTTCASDETLAIQRILDIQEDLLLEPEEGRMEALLRNMNEIPPGMIFLPGKRLSTPGFRWAPSTWMVGRQLEYPDPLSLPSKQSTFPQGYSLRVCHSLLSVGGLMVRYPGFRLHNLVRSPERSRVRFPVDYSLQQWYNVKHGAEDDGEIDLWDNIPSDETTDLAIICCRSAPGTTAEIALLVSIKGEDNETLLVSWVVRVFIELEVETSQLEEYRQDFKQDPERFLWGEELNPDQLWVVD